MREKWLPVDGYEGTYEVSSLGRIKRLAGVRRARNNTTAVVNEKILNPGIQCKGYKIVVLSRDNLRRSFLVHRLVAAAFLGAPREGQEVNHKNGVKPDNRVENLEWVSRSENHLHKCRELKLSNRRPICVKNDGSPVALWFPSQTECAHHFGWTTGNIYTYLQSGKPRKGWRLIDCSDLSCHVASF